MALAYTRVLLKISGEFFGSHDAPVDMNKIDDLARIVIEMGTMGAQIGMMVGGGNIFRKRSIEKGMIDEYRADYMGIIGTIINAMALSARIQALGKESIVQSALPIQGVVDQIDADKAQEALACGCVVVFGGGTGKPMVTTDTGAVMRAIDIGAEIIIKATKVLGVFDQDPISDPSAVMYQELSMQEAIDKQLGVLDQEAMRLAQERGIAVLVLQCSQDNIIKALQGEKIGTLVRV